MAIHPPPDKSFMEALQTQLPSLLPDFLLQQRWFGGKARVIQSVEIPDVVPFGINSYLIVSTILYASGPTDTYAIPLVLASGETAPLRLSIQRPNSAEPVVLNDALNNEQFLSGLLDLIAKQVSLPGVRGSIHAVPTSALQLLLQSRPARLKPSVM